jgi:hypothetical protein
MRSGNLNFLEPSGPLQACNGTECFTLLLIPITLTVKHIYIRWWAILKEGDETLVNLKLWVVRSSCRSCIILRENTPPSNEDLCYANNQCRFSFCPYNFSPFYLTCEETMLLARYIKQPFCNFRYDQRSLIKINNLKTFREQL